MDRLLHITINPKLRQRMEDLVEAGMFTSHAELVREGLRDLLVLHSSGRIRHLPPSRAKR